MVRSLILPPVQAKADTNLLAVGDTSPRVLNIYCGGASQDKLPAVCVAIAKGADVVNTARAATAAYPFGHFAVIRTVGILDQLPENEAAIVLKEWKRVLHRFGVLHVVLSAGQVEQLSRYLRKAGFSHVDHLRPQRDLGYLSGVVEAAIAKDQVVLSAGRPRMPHSYLPPLSETAFAKKCAKFCRSVKANPASSYVIPVHNEAASLPHFLESLDSAANQTQTQREFIFVLNGCTDESEKILTDYIGSSSRDCLLVTSKPGMINAFIAGIGARKLRGFIGTMDSDVVLHPHALDLLQIELVECPEVQVAYAEPLPLGGQTRYNEPVFKPQTMSKRLAYVRQTSLLRSVPFGRFQIKSLLVGLASDDIFLSLYFVYFYGLDSIRQVPHAVTHAKHPTSYADLVVNVSRLYSEVRRQHAAYPPFQVLDKVFAREIYSPAFRRAYLKAVSEFKYVDGWTRINSTKG